VLEQNVPEEIEWDGIDPDCTHAIAHAAGGEAIGCARLLPDGHIGRMAVRREWRGRGAGAALLQHLLALAVQAGHTHVMLNAQTHAMPFYERYGFAPIDEEFMEAGIAHRTMQRAL
jgi:predicted GNAT family N-acyltransferase